MLPGPCPSASSAPSSTPARLSSCCAAAAGVFRDPALLAHLDSDSDLFHLCDRDDFQRFRAALKPVK